MNEVTPSGAQFIVDLKAAGGTLYAGSLNHGIRISRDRGLTWTFALDGRSIARAWIDPGQPSHVLAADGNFAGGLYETRDAGATWSSAGEGFPTTTMPDLGGTILALAFDAVSNPQRLYATVRSITRTRS